MLTLIDLRGRREDPSSLLPRASVDLDAARESVRAVVRDVRSRGDAAVRDAERRFGGTPREDLRIPPEEIASGRSESGPALVSALESAAARIRAYHEEQAARERAPEWRLEDGRVGEWTRPLARVGCRAPGGLAAYPSTILMTAIPARVAGVPEVAVCVPPAPDGSVLPAMLAALSVAGVEEAYAVGGVQAVSAMAYGTESIRRVDRIVGPGSLWVTLAKHEVCMDVGIDAFQGPTEVAIVADASTPAAFVAADLVAQAEHDPLASAILITPSEDLVAGVEEELARRVPNAARHGVISRALAGQGAAVLVEDLDRAVEVANAFAPEHLELACRGAEELLPKVRGAGAVFVGAYSPVALGDYVAGTNHCLPTAGSARFSSPLRVSDFLKSTAVVRFDRESMAGVVDDLGVIAEAEGLPAHAAALRVRLEREP